MSEKIIVTSALPYANGKIHLGHLSGAYLPADIYVRYKRLTGADILYICGSDEHGVPITITADKEGKKPNEIIDRYHNLNKEAFERFGMSFDIYSRTSTPLHHETAKTFFLNFYEQGLLNEKVSLQFYDEKAKMFLPDRYVEGTCPKCGNEEARSDECENCGASYDQSELLNPKSKISGEKPILKETTHWYFPLGKFQERLEQYVEKQNKQYGWKDNVLQQCKSWFNDVLKDRAITRDLDWGVKVPLENADGKVLYVWFEAVLGYISATKELSINKGNPELWKEYWQNKETKYVAFIGKDNIVFHTIIFPALLMAWNDSGKEEYLLPENVPANEFLNFEGKKFSKSRNWGIDVIDFLDLFPADSLRYTLAANLPENKDTDFFWKEFQMRNNSELADIFGNFVNRTLTFTNKHFEGKVPELGDLSDADKEMISLLKDYPKRVADLLEKYKIKDAVFEVMNLARIANKYFNDQTPWVTIKADKKRCGTTLNICINIINTLSLLFYPIIPFTSEKLFKILNVKPKNWFDSGNLNLTTGHCFNTPEILFTKIEDEKIEAQKVVEEVQTEPKISFEEFSKVDLRIAEIIHAENVKKSEKLLKLNVKVGETKRQIVAGIAKSYKPEDLIGKKVVIVFNLQPAKLFGIDSEGMILAVENEEGNLNVINVDEKVKSGTKVK
ncbi:MAG TPA: methionine--tRNA ligase [Melioribacteraceae bacterium]|nr:methionine--tRNA ligase [Melioribacteraceae bacterium]